MAETFRDRIMQVVNNVLSLVDDVLFDKFGNYCMFKHLQYYIKLN